MQWPKPHYTWLAEGVGKREDKPQMFCNFYRNVEATNQASAGHTKN
jgi:hypothetical protein